MDTLFFVASKTIGLLARADAWFFILACATAISAIVGRARATRRLALFNLVFVAAFGFFPLGDLLIGPFERANPPAGAVGKPDGIILLGGAEDRLATGRWGQLQINAAGERFAFASQLSRQFPQARIVFSGGQGLIGELGKDQRSFTLFVREYFAELGVDPDRVSVEGQSRNTAENAKMSYALARPKPGEHWLLVTSAFHMPRALRSFERVGWTGVQPFPVDYRSHAFGERIGWQLAENLDTANIALKEWVGLVVYGVTGR